MLAVGASRSPNTLDLAAALGTHGSASSRAAPPSRRHAWPSAATSRRSSSCVSPALIAVGVLAVVRGQPGPDILRDASASLFPVLYIGLPLGALAAIRSIGGRDATLLLMATIVVSDSAQYYTGRALGRHQLAPAISPKKTVEGAIGGLVFGTAAMTFGGLEVFQRRQPLAARR